MSRRATRASFVAETHVQAAVVKSFDEGTKPGREYVAPPALRATLSHPICQVRLRHCCRRAQGTAQGHQENERQPGERIGTRAVDVVVLPPAIAHERFSPSCFVIPNRQMLTLFPRADPEAQQGQALPQAGQLLPRHAHTVPPPPPPLPSPFPFPTVVLPVTPRRRYSVDGAMQFKDT
jgi:hypothetical protein